LKIKEIRKNTMQLTVKQENFCMKYIETGNASEAYRKAYDTKNMKPETIHKRASELLGNGEVTGRIEGLKKEHRNRHDVTIDSITLELEEARQLAISTEHASAAVSATMGKAKIHGLLVDKNEITEKKSLFPTSVPKFANAEEAMKFYSELIKSDK
jgi:phage terminase small subunit